MSRSVWRSLQTRIVMLALVACLFLAVAVGSFYRFLRSDHQAMVEQARRHLSYVATTLSRAYSAQAAQGVSLQRSSVLVRHHHGPPPPPGPDEPAPGTPPPPPSDPLAQVTANVLGNEQGIEGGFLAGNGSLVGYSFPTHEGPGDDHNEIPPRERPTIDQLAHRAEQTGKAQSSSIEGPRDVILFAAEPVQETLAGARRTTGAVWLMQRLPDPDRGRTQQLLLASIGFGAAALVTALLAWFVTVEVNGGVAAVTHRLLSLERDLNHPDDVSDRPQLQEFDRVLSGINTMAVALQHRIKAQQTLEQQLRHKERLSSLGQFAAGVAHELRNPLATIRLRAQMSQHTALSDPAITRNHGVILEEVDRLDAMIGRLLYFARPITLELQTIDVRELCGTVVQAWTARAPEAVTVRCDAAAAIPIRVDRNRILQVLDNLVENAVQSYRGQPGEVVIQAAPYGDTVRIDVLDRGAGFSADALEHAFDPFYTTRDAGTGLGLSIAFELVQAHNGQLQAASRAGGGAVVSILLPRGTAEQETSS